MERFRRWRGQSYALDIFRIGPLGLRVRGWQPENPARYETSRAPLVAPCEGRVAVAADRLPDMPVPQMDEAHRAGNYVMIGCGGFAVALAHLRAGSVLVAEGQRVELGDPIGEIGNSGASSEPHLHIHAQRGVPEAHPFGGEPLPLGIDGRFLVRNDRLRCARAAISSRSKISSSPTPAGQSAFHRRHPETAAELARRIIATEGVEDVPTELLLLEALLDGARIDAEGRGTKGPAVLDAIERSIDRRAGESRPGLSLLGRCYVRASLKPPERLKMSVRDASIAANAGTAAPDLDELISRMRDDARGDPYAFHAALSQMLATYDAEIQETLVQTILDRFDPAFARLGCYWLLNPSPDLRRVAADAFLGHARQGRLDAATRSRLTRLRNWMPADAARATIDSTLRTVLRQDQAGEPITGSWTLHRILASIPDGSGGQSFAVAVRQGERRCIVMVLLKQAYGVRDAFVVPCSSATEQKQRLGFVEREMGAFEVDPGFLSTALAAARGKHRARGATGARTAGRRRDLWH